MPVFRVHKTENYTVMSNNHLQNENLSLKAKGLMSLMLSLPVDWDYSARGLATLSRDGEDAVKAGLKELENNGYLKRNPIREKGVIKDWQYDIYENPQNPENIESEPEGEKPLVVKPLVENESQINTNIQNTKEINNTFTTVKVQAQPVRRHLVTVNESTNTVSKPKKKNLYDKCLDDINEFTQDNKLRDVLVTYLKMRLEMKDSPIYHNQWLGLLNNLKKLSDTVTGMIEIVQQSINRGYRGFFEVKQYKKGGQDPSVFSEYGQVKSVHSNEVAMNVQF